MLVSDETLLKAATLTEVGDAMMLPPPGRKVLFVLAGYGHALRSNYSLAEPEEFDLTVRLANGTRTYQLGPTDFRVFPKAGKVTVDLPKTVCFRLNTPQHDHFRIILVARDEQLAQEFEALMTPLAFEAAAADDWRLQNALEWCVTEHKATAGELQPETGIKLPEKLRWRLRKPVFRQDDHQVRYQWELCSLIDGPYERPLLTCVTDHEGTITRQADLVPIRLLFAGGRAAAATQAPAAAPAPGPAPVPVAAPAMPAAAATAPVRMPAPQRTSIVPPPKPVPDARRKALEERMKAAGEAEMAKIKKLFEMPD